MAYDQGQQIAAQEAYLAALQNGTAQPYYQQQQYASGQSADLMRMMATQQIFDRINQSLAVERQAADNAIAHMLPAFLAYPALAQIANDAEALGQVVANYDILVTEALRLRDEMLEIAKILDAKLHDPDFLLEHAFGVWGQYNLNDQAKASIAQKFMMLMGEEPSSQLPHNPVPNSVSAAQLATMQRTTMPIPPVPAEAPSQQMTKMDVLRNTMGADDTYAVLNSLKQRR